MAGTLDIEPADLQAALDPEESARVSLEDGYTVIIVDVPVPVPDKGEGVYTTIPLGILLTQHDGDDGLRRGHAGAGGLHRACGCGISAPKRRCGSSTRSCTAPRRCTSWSCGWSTGGGRRSRKNLAGSSTRDSDLIELHALESTLVYFATSLRANSTVLDRLTPLQAAGAIP